MESSRCAQISQASLIAPITKKAETASIKPSNARSPLLFLICVKL